MDPDLRNIVSRMEVLREKVSKAEQEKIRQRELDKMEEEREATSRKRQREKDLEEEVMEARKKRRENPYEETEAERTARYKRIEALEYEKRRREEAEERNRRTAGSNKKPDSSGNDEDFDPETSEQLMKRLRRHSEWVGEDWVDHGPARYMQMDLDAHEEEVEKGSKEELALRLARLRRWIKFYQNRYDMEPRRMDEHFNANEYPIYSSDVYAADMQKNLEELKKEHKLLLERAGAMWDRKHKI
jgi:hypothetical protein